MQERIKVWVGTDWDGFTFRLRPKTRKMLAERFPDAYMLPQISISFDERTSIEAVNESVYAHIAEMLLGIPYNEIQKIGGVRFHDTESEQLIYDTAGI